MAKIYNPVGWEDGKIINPAIADLTTGIVTPAEVSGTTPVNAENLKHMDEAIKQLYDEGASSKDIYIGDDNPPEDTKIWINTGEISPMHSEVVNSLSGNETAKAPSVQAVNNRFSYSTEEQIIGKWIDNKPIYRKVIIHSFKHIASSSDYVDYQIAHNVDNLGQIINLRMFSSKNDWFPCVSTSGLFAIPVEVTNEYVILRNKDGWGDRDFIIILEYTKTTDSAKKTINEEPTSEEVTI